MRHAHARHMLAVLGACAAVSGVCGGTQAALTRAPTNEQVIRQVFGAYGSQAVAVARCESGLSVWARSPGGTYLGLFQFGSFARARYGFGWDAWTQARAAYRYFRDSGYRWTAWTCRPY